jgi:hypothetical protein
MNNHVTSNPKHFGSKVKRLLTFNNMQQKEFAKVMLTYQINITKLVKTKSINELTDGLLLGLYYFLSIEVKDIFISDDLTKEEKELYKLILGLYKSVVGEIEKRQGITTENNSDRGRK